MKKRKTEFDECLSMAKALQKRKIDSLDAKMHMLDMLFEEEIEEARMAGDSKEARKISIAYIEKRERMIEEHEQSDPGKRIKMRYSSELLLHLIKEAKRTKNDVPNTVYAQFLALVTNYSYKTINNYLSNREPIDNTVLLEKINDLLNRMGFKEIDTKQK